MVGRFEYDSNATSGRGEEKTNDLRMKDGKLQQKFIITTMGPEQPLEVVEEWRDVPEE